MDKRNMQVGSTLGDKFDLTHFIAFEVSKQLVPFFVGLTVLGIGICFGYNCGYAVNPARDFAPRLFSGKQFYRQYVL